MNPQKLIITLLSAVLIVSACQPQVTPTPQVAETVAQTILPYQDVSLSPEERAADLLARMTLDERIGQMTLIEKNSLPAEAVTQYFIGGVLSGGGGSPISNTPEGWAKMVDGYQDAALKTRLGIPVIYGVDAVHGHGNLKGAVIFPHNIGMGATGDAGLVRRVARATAEEMVATNIRWNYAPVVAVPQDIRWGRTYEGFGENTALVTELGVAYLEGLQGADISDLLSVVGTPKHFIGDGGTVWGTSTTNNYQSDQGDMQADEATLRAYFLPPYQAIVEAGAQSIMVSFSSWNGTKMHAQKYLLTDVLKGELGFKGFLVSDWQAIDQIDRNYYTAVVTAINAGVDMNMVPTEYKKFIDTMKLAVQKGDISADRINDAVWRILTVKFRMGLFENPFSNPEYLSLVGSDEHRALAREAVAKSLVLLKNDNAALPIAKDAGLIFIAGEAADDIGIQSGGWTIEWQGKAGSITSGTTIRDAIEAIATGQVQYNRFGKYENIKDANGNPAIADMGIVVIGEKMYAEGVGDRANLSISQTDADLIQRVRERSQKVVVIIISGRPLVITDQLGLADAWVAAWLPGTEGQGVADVLFGDVPFTGKLPYSWPRSNSQLPLGFKTLPTEGCDAPLFPFGYGLDTAASQPVIVPVCP